MGPEFVFIGLAILSVGAFLGVGISQIVRRLRGDRLAFQSRLQSEQLQKQTREMREQATRLEALEAERAEFEATKLRQEETVQGQLGQLTAIRNEIAEKLERMSREATAGGETVLAQAIERLILEQEKADRARRERDEAERARQAEERSERQRFEEARIEREKARDEQERAERQRFEEARLEREKARDEQERAERERLEQARIERERALFERLERVQPATADRASSETAIRTLIQPITETLARFDQKLAAIEDTRRQSLGAIVQHLEQVARVHADVRDETRRLAKALESSPKGFGPWGEHQLRNILELAGMAPYIDLLPGSGGGDSALEAVLRLPGNRRLAIDGNVPTQPYLAATTAADPAAEERGLAEHAAVVRRHLEMLASDAFRDRFEIKPDLTVLFLPGENLLGAALAKDPALFEDGVRRQVLLATPSTLVALAKSVAHSWTQETSLENVRELAAIGTELLDRMSAIGDQVDELGRGLEASVRSYNGFVGDLQATVMGHLRRLRELAPGAGKRDLREPQPVDLAVRVPRRRRSFVITQAGQEAAAAITPRPEGPPIPVPARAIAPTAALEPQPEAPRPSADPVQPF